MIHLKTLDSLTEAELDTMVAKIENIKIVQRHGLPFTEHEFDPEGPAHEFSAKEWKMWKRYNPSTNWDLGGLIIDRDGIWLLHNTAANTHGAQADGHGNYFCAGPTSLMAAMRVHVARNAAKLAAD
jgi:hypothetical protein